MATQVQPSRLSTSPPLSRRWTELRGHQQQWSLTHHPARFKVVPAGRRSGKTELAKRHLVESLPIPKPWDDPRYFFGAPTRDQAKRIAWDDLIALTPKSWLLPGGRGISHSDLCIRTIFGSSLWVLGMDVPARMEGVGWDGGVGDELSDWKPGTFD